MLENRTGKYDGCMKKERQQETIEENDTKYQIRKAAGIYWLIDIEQEGVPYRRPIPLNKMGADIWQCLAQGENPKMIAEKLSKEYDMEQEAMQKDISCFIKQLKEQDVFCDVGEEL